MRLTTWILYFVLFALLGIGTVQARSRRIEASYALAEQLGQERRLRERLEAKRLVWARLTSPSRLERLRQRQGDAYAPLTSRMPPALSEPWSQRDGGYARCP